MLYGYCGLSHAKTIFFKKRRQLILRLYLILLDYLNYLGLSVCCLLYTSLDKIEAEMTDIMKFNDSVIMTIPGIGYINGGMIPVSYTHLHHPNVYSGAR